MVKMIEKNKGFARIHSHGKIKNILDYIVQMGASATDPIEPPPQGDVELSYVKEKYGKDLVLFGNIEIADIENTPNNDFKKIVSQALIDGTKGQGRGFVLMPSASPYGRDISKTTMKNYETMVELTENFKG
jgi:uroporphyrinogen-III decarboxylase